MKYHLKRSRSLMLTPLVLLIVLIVACGTAAPVAEEQSSSPATSAPSSSSAPSGSSDSGSSSAPSSQAQATPVASAEPAMESPMVTEPTGTLNVGQKEIGGYDGHPKLVVNPALFVSQTAPLGEGLVYSTLDREMTGWLAESWTISPDFTTWTFNLQEGVQFHKGYGEMTSEDVVWSYVEGWANNEKHVRFSMFNDFWKAEGGSVTAPDDYTVVVNTGTPQSEPVHLENWLNTPGGSANWVMSKRQAEELGDEASSKMPALTGSWEFVEEAPAQYWKMRAVRDHWKQTPEFDELVFWEIPEESSRIAGYQTGNLDTFLMAFDSIPLVEDLPGTKFVTVPGAVETGILFYGNYVVQAEAGEPPESFDPEAPWISAKSDVTSPEWQNAVKVRQALSLAVDREAITETILQGYAHPIAMRYWGNHESQLEGRKWEYDPDRAIELLNEAGHPDGFSITLTTAIRGAPAEIEACEAVGTMWGDIGIDVNFQRIPYTTLRPSIVGRTYKGATCHSIASKVATVGSLPQLTVAASFNHGATHPFLEDIMPKIAGAVDPKELSMHEAEMGKFLFDNAMTSVGLYQVDVVWPAGPRIEPWTEHVKTRDLRNINGYEFIRHRAQ